MTHKTSRSFKFQWTQQRMMSQGQDDLWKTRGAQITARRLAAARLLILAGLQLVSKICFMWPTTQYSIKQAACAFAAQAACLMHLHLQLCANAQSCICTSSPCNSSTSVQPARWNRDMRADKYSTIFWSTADLLPSHYCNPPKPIMAMKCACSTITLQHTTMHMACSRVRVVGENKESECFLILLFASC